MTKADDKDKQDKLPAIELQDRQSAIDLMLSPDDAHVFVLVSERPVGARTVIVPNWVNETGYVEDINGRTAVGDAQNRTLLAVLNLHTGKSVWADSGFAPPVDEPKPATETAAELLKAAPGITAVLAMSDILALATVTAARAQGTNVPRDLSVVGFDDIPEAAAAAIRCTHEQMSRVIAVGTTVVRGLEHAASSGTIRAGEGLATQRIGPGTRLRAVDAILSGTHEPGTSHYELLRAFADDRILERASKELDLHGYRTHEFGDSVMLEAAFPHFQRLRGAP